MFAVTASDGDLGRYIYPLEKPHPAPTIVVDYSDAPDAEAWAKVAQKLASEWYPALTSMLATEAFKSPEKVTLVFKKDLQVPAYASGSTITINGKWIAQNPHDFGVVIHEMVHVIQRYPDYPEKKGWLVEGIADYVRWWRYEPDAPRPRIDAVKSKYTDAYRTTASFLAWVSDKYDKRLVPALDRALRNKEDPMPVFEKMTGKSADDLWAEFVAPR